MILPETRLRLADVGKTVLFPRLRLAEIMVEAESTEGVLSCGSYFLHVRESRRRVTNEGRKWERKQRAFGENKTAVNENLKQRKRER